MFAASTSARHTRASRATRRRAAPRPLAALAVLLALVATACQAAPAAPSAGSTPATAAKPTTASPAPAATTAPAAQAPASVASPAAAAKPATSSSPAAAAGLAAGGAPAAQPKPANRLTVHFGGINGTPDRALFVAQELGYFEEQNLDVQVETFQSATQMIPLLATGKLDAGHGGSSPAFFNAFLQGAPVKIVSDVTILSKPAAQVRGSQHLVVRKQVYDQGVKTVKDLKGKKVAINNPGGLNHAQLEDTLKANGLTLVDVQIETVGFNDMLTAVANGAVDAAVALEPFVTQGEDRGIWVSVYDTTDALRGQTAQWLFYSQDFPKNNPEAGKRLIVAYTKALRWIEDAEAKDQHRDQYVAIMTKNTPVKDPVLFARIGRNFQETNARVNMNQLEKDQAFYLRMGGMKQRVEPATMVDTSFGDYARQVLGPYQ